MSWVPQDIITNTLNIESLHQGFFFLNVFNKLCFISLVYYVHNSWSCPRVLSCRSRGTFTSQHHKHPLLEGEVLSKCKKNRAQSPHQDYTTLNRFYSCCHFILWKWKVVFTGIKFSFYPEKKKRERERNSVKIVSSRSSNFIKMSAFTPQGAALLVGNEKLFVLMVGNTHIRKN